MAFMSMLPGAAQANTLSFYNDADTLDTLRFTLSCSLGCTAWDGSAFTSPEGDLFTLANNSEALELATINSLSGGSFTLADYTKTDSGGVSALSFMSSAMYILIKIGRSPDVAVIMNTFVDNVFEFTAIAGTGSGLSHYSEVGLNRDIDPDPIPLPGGIVLLLSGLVGLGGLARMRKAAAKA